MLLLRYYTSFYLINVRINTLHLKVGHMYLWDTLSFHICLQLEKIPVSTQPYRSKHGLCQDSSCSTNLCHSHHWIPRLLILIFPVSILGVNIFSVYHIHIIKEKATWKRLFSLFIAFIHSVCVYVYMWLCVHCSGMCMEIMWHLQSVSPSTCLPRAQTQVIRLDGKHSMSHLREFLRRHIQMVLLTCLFIINIAHQLYNSVKSKQERTRIGRNDRALQGEEEKEEGVLWTDVFVLSCVSQAALKITVWWRVNLNSWSSWLHAPHAWIKGMSQHRPNML